MEGRKRQHKRERTNERKRQLGAAHDQADVLCWALKLSTRMTATASRHLKDVLDKQTGEGCRKGFHVGLGLGMQPW